MDLARMIVESLTPKPGIRERPRPTADMRHSHRPTSKELKQSLAAADQKLWVVDGARRSPDAHDGIRASPGGQSVC
jgi:hypothetical protein